MTVKPENKSNSNSDCKEDDEKALFPLLQMLKHYKVNVFMLKHYTECQQTAVFVLNVSLKLLHTFTVGKWSDHCTKLNQQNSLLWNSFMKKESVSLKHNDKYFNLNGDCVENSKKKKKNKHCSSKMYIIHFQAIFLFIGKCILVSEQALYFKSKMMEF